MKKTSLAVMIGLFAIGCEKAPTKAPAPNIPDMKQMAEHMKAVTPAQPAAGAEEKKEEEKKEGAEEVKPEVKAEEAAPTVEEKKE